MLYACIFELVCKYAFVLTWFIGKIAMFALNAKIY
jgi:hypothetical protein